MAEQNRDTLVQLQNLHPDATPARDALPVGMDPEIPPLQLTLDDLRAEAIPKLSASACSGWTSELIAALTEGDEDSSRLVLRLFNHMLDGTAGPPELWVRSRLVPLRKPCGGIRQFSVGDAWIRLLSRIVARKSAAEAYELLSPVQWAIGASGGSEIIIHHVAVYAQEVLQDGGERGILTIDFKNAFNTLGRRCIFDQLTVHFPGLARFYHWTYHCPAPLYLSDGTLATMSATGVRQGDPLGSLFFCLGLQPILLQLCTEFPECHVLAYADDVTVLGRTILLDPFLSRSEVLGNQIGLRFNGQNVTYGQGLIRPWV